VVERHFTLEQAARALDSVRPIAERMVAAGERLAAVQARHAPAASQVAGNGGGSAARSLGSLQLELRRAADEIAGCISELEQHGVLVKDPARGLLDFPALRDGETVLLCWHVGEAEIAFWHGWDDGYAGRRPLPL
jgi:hypothetical protein